MSVEIFKSSRNAVDYTGYRARRSVGGVMHQHYYSFSRFSKKDALRLATEKDAELKAEAERCRVNRKSGGKPLSRATCALLDTPDPARIAKYFQAKLSHHNKQVVLKGGRVTQYVYTYPEFIVSVPSAGRMSVKRFRVDQFGFELAFSLAATAYLRAWMPNHTARDKAIVESWKPHRSVFYIQEYERVARKFGAKDLPTANKIKIMCA